MDITRIFSLILPLGIAGIALSDAAFAEPHIAQRYGLQCSSCHSNVTGGGKRTAAGLGYAMALTDSPVSSPFAPNIAEAISIGGNFRADWTYNQFDDPEASPQGVVGEEIEDTSAFSISNGAIYLEFALSDTLAFYLDQQVAPEGGRTREAFGLYRGVLGDQDYLKVGKFFLPFGLRLQDDDAFIRGVTGFNFDNSDIGVEYGAEHGPFAYSVAVTNGTQGSGENNTDKLVSSVFSFVQPKYRLGISLSKNNAPNNHSEEMVGIFGGLTLGKWVFLGEIDTKKEIKLNEAAPAEEVRATTLIGYAAIDYLISTSTNVKFSYEYLDPDDTNPENERTRFSLLGETFLNQYSQLRYGLRRYDSIPQNTLENRTVLFSEFHVFF